MASDKPSGGMIPPFIQMNATTTAPNFVTSAITPDARLEAKTPLVVLAEAPEGLTASVFRESTKVKGQYSRDVYLWSGKGWRRCGNDEQKYPSVPYPPAGAVQTRVEGVDVWTMKPLTGEEVERLRTLIAVLRGE